MAENPGCGWRRNAARKTGRPREAERSHSLRRLGCGGNVQGRGVRRSGRGRTARQEVNQQRRRLAWVFGNGISTAWFLAFFRFFLPRTLFEPSTVFKIGYPSDYGLGVDTKWQQKYRIWVDRRPDRIFVIYARCTHLGCTPDWKASENKFKCPCHGSGYDDEGVNFEGPAPRPMDRAFIANCARRPNHRGHFAALFSGPKASRANSTIRERICDV